MRIFILLGGILLVVGGIIFGFQYTPALQERLRSFSIREYFVHSDEKKYERTSISSPVDVQKEFCTKIYFNEVDLRGDITSQNTFDTYIQEVLEDDNLHEARIAIAFYAKSISQIDTKQGEILVQEELQESRDVRENFEKKYTQDVSLEKLLEALYSASSDQERAVVLRSIAQHAFDAGDFDQAYQLQECLARSYRDPLAMLWMAYVLLQGTEGVQEISPHIAVENPVEQNIYEAYFWSYAAFGESILGDSILKPTSKDLREIEDVMREIDAQEGFEKDIVVPDAESFLQHHYPFLQHFYFQEDFDLSLLRL